VKAKAYQADTSDQAKMHEIVKQVYDDLGPVGGIVCNAGQANQKPALEAKREDFDACFDTNVWGAFVCAQACAALWKEHGYKNGKVVIVSCKSERLRPSRTVSSRWDDQANRSAPSYSHLWLDRQQGQPAVFLQRLQGEHRIVVKEPVDSSTKTALLISVGCRQLARQVPRYGVGRHGYQRQLHLPWIRRVSLVAQGEPHEICDTLLTPPVRTGRTDMTAGFLQDEEKKAEKMKDVPMGRPSQPEEQAGMAILLLSDRASCESARLVEIRTIGRND